MDLIDRAKLLKDYTQTFVVGHGMKAAETFRGVVKQAQKVDAVPMSVIDEIKAEIEEKYGNCDICEYFEDYDYEENDISEYRPIGNIADILQIIDKYRNSEVTE